MINGEERENLLDAFLQRWSIDEVRGMSLSEYVGVENKDTFCQWVETKTRNLGSIKGGNSLKFGIYQRKDSSKRLQNYQNDDQYTWRKVYGETRDEAFRNVKANLIRIIELSEKDDFSSIDKIELSSLFKWKIAFLYSNERLIPIYAKDVLYKIAKHYDEKLTNRTPISHIQHVMIQNKPVHLNVYQYMQHLFAEFGTDRNNSDASQHRHLPKRRTRKAAESRAINPQLRTARRSYIAEQKHNKLQVRLKDKLIREYGSSNVLLEENFVDVKVMQSDYITFYEVKSAPYASDCIRQALGQLLSYAFYDTDDRPKRLVVVGQYEPNDGDRKFIDYLNANLGIRFSYLNLNIS